MPQSVVTASALQRHDERQGFADGLDGERLSTIANGELLAIHARDTNAEIVWIGRGQRRDIGRHRAVMVVAVFLMEMR